MRLRTFWTNHTHTHTHTHTHIYIYIYIYIYIMLTAGFLFYSLAFCHHWPSLHSGPLNGMQCLQRAWKLRFNQLGNAGTLVRKCRFRVCPYFYSSALYNLLGWFVRLEVSCCFIGCSFEDMFKTARVRLVQFVFLSPRISLSLWGEVIQKIDRYGTDWDR